MLNQDQGRWLNRANTRFIYHKGIVLHMKAWADAIGINYNTLSSRLNQYGYTVEKALTEPVKVRSKRQ